MTRLTLPLLVGLFVLALAATAAMSAQRSRILDERKEESAERERPRESSPAPVERRVPVAAETEPLRPVREPRPRGFGVAKLRSGKTVVLRKSPRGSSLARVASRTEFGSERALSVAEVRGPWLGVTTELRPNGDLAWVDSRSESLKLSRTRVSLRADLSRRTLVLREDGEVVKRIKVAIGRPGSPTPTGRFSVTDKLSGSDYGSYYGCCILALSGTQPSPPPGWQGGNRLAIHGTNSPGTIGQAASAGCLRAADAALRTLMRRVPVGAPVFIRR